jgi:predicted phage-related endonuclease
MRRHPVAREARMTIERVDITSTDAWLAERPHWANASEMPIICGESNYGSLAELYAEKKGLRPPLVDSAIFRRGRWGESAVFQALSEERPEWNVQRARVHVRDTERRMACTPDGFAIAPERDGIGIVQAKIVSRSVFRDRWLDNAHDSVADGAATPPPAYRLQTLTEMMLNECAWGVLAVLISSEFDWRLRLFDVHRNEAIEARILDRAAAFWHDYMDPGIMPAFEPQRDAELVRALFPKDDGTEIDLTRDNRALELVEEWTEVGAAASRLNKAEKGIKTELCGKIGEHTYARLADGRRLSWKHQHRKAHTAAASDFRVLRIHSNKAED